MIEILKICMILSVIGVVDNWKKIKIPLADLIEDTIAIWVILIIFSLGVLFPIVMVLLTANYN